MSPNQIARSFILRSLSMKFQTYNYHYNNAPQSNILTINAKQCTNVGIPYISRATESYHHTIDHYNIIAPQSNTLFTALS